MLNFSKSKPRKKKGDDMKNLTKRADGRWTGRKQIDGKTIIVYARSQKKCYEKLKQAIQKPAPKTKHNTNKIKLLDFANTWFETYKKNQIGTKNQESYKNVIKNHLSHINKNIQDITSLDIQTFLNNMPATRIKEFTFMVAKQIFRKAKELKIEAIWIKAHQGNVNFEYNDNLPPCSNIMPCNDDISGDIYCYYWTLTDIENFYTGPESQKKNDDPNPAYTVLKEYLNEYYCYDMGFLYKIEEDGDLYQSSSLSDGQRALLLK